MPKMTPLYEHIGEPVMLIEPDAYTSGTIVCSDNDASVVIDGLTSVLFLLQIGDADTCSSVAVSINYSCDTEGSNANTTSGTWHSTDAVFVAITSAGVNEIYLMEFDISRKGLTEAGSSLFASVVLTDAIDMALCAIPVPGTKWLPSTNENAVVYAYGNPDT
jgi:hypothetical protein